MTKPIRVVISPWERFKRLTVWHPLNTDPTDDHRWGPRVWLPTYDLMALGLGVYAYFLGSPLLNRTFPDWTTDIGSIVLMAAAVFMLVGVCFPKLALLELIGKLIWIFLLAAYAGTVAFMSSSGTDPNGFVVIVLVMAVWLLLPRVTVLFAQISRVRQARRQSKKQEELRRQRGM